jgi:hypothetical protein
MNSKSVVQDKEWGIVLCRKCMHARMAYIHPLKNPRNSVDFFPQSASNHPDYGSFNLMILPIIERRYREAI